MTVIVPVIPVIVSNGAAARAAENGHVGPAIFQLVGVALIALAGLVGWLAGERIWIPFDAVYDRLGAWSFALGMLGFFALTFALTLVVCWITGAPL